MSKLGKHAAVYGAATVLSKVASVALLPVYTRFLSPAQYGLLQLLELAAEVTYILFTAGTRSGLMRFYYKATSNDERRLVVSTTFVLEVALAVLGALFLIAVARFAWEFVLLKEGSVELVRLAALHYLLATLANTPLSLLQVEQRALAFASVQVAKLVLQVGFNLYFLVYLEMGVTGMMLSGVVVNVVIGVSLAGWFVGRVGLRVSAPVMRELRKFGVPHQLTIAGGFVLTFGDRFFLQQFGGAAIVGLYAMAYQFGFLLFQVGSGPFLRAWYPQLHSQVTLPQQERDSKSTSGFFQFNLVLITCATGMILFARPAIRLLTTPEFYSAASVIPTVVAAYVVHGWVEAVRFGIDVSEKTFLYTIASWLSVLAVVIGYFVLIPPLGAHGAALATLIAFVVRLILTVRLADSVWKVEYGWRRIVPMLCVSAAASVGAVALSPTNLAAAFAWATAVFSAYSAVLWRWVLGPPHRQALTGWMKETRVVVSGWVNWRPQ